MSKRARLAIAFVAAALALTAVAVAGWSARRSLRAAWRALLRPELVERSEPAGGEPGQCGVLREPSGELDEQIALDFQALDALSLDDPDAAALSGLTTTDLSVAITRRTLRFVRFFGQDPIGRKAFRERFRRSGLYRSGIEQQLREAGVPEDLVWLAAIESAFDPQALSPMGAAGMWQFMPETGALYGLDMSPWLDERRSITRATEAAVTHLRDLYDRLGSWDLALAAYNMGYDGLLQAMQAYVERRAPDKRDAGPPTFAELAQARLLPHETADYVPKVTAFAIVAANLVKFDHDDVAAEEPLHLATLAVPEATPLSTIARAGGLSLSEIRQLNPELLRDRIPPTGGDYLVTLPSERLEHTRAALPAYLDHEVLELESSAALPAMPAPLVLGGSSDAAMPAPASGLRRPPHLGPNRLPAFGVPGSRAEQRDPLGLGPAIVTLDPSLPSTSAGTGSPTRCRCCAARVPEARRPGPTRSPSSSGSSPSWAPSRRATPSATPSTSSGCRTGCCCACARTARRHESRSPYSSRLRRATRRPSPAPTARSATARRSAAATWTSV
jgi:membrane-bound lytic murein transglycosylase D